MDWLVVYCICSLTIPAHNQIYENNKDKIDKKYSYVFFVNYSNPTLNMYIKYQKYHCNNDGWNDKNARLPNVYKNKIKQCFNVD